LGKEEEVIKYISQIPQVIEVRGTYGVHDIFVKIKTESVDEMNYTITSYIRKINGITSTVTLVSIPEQGGREGRSHELVDETIGSPFIAYYDSTLKFDKRSNMKTDNYLRENNRHNYINKHNSTFNKGIILKIFCIVLPVLIIVAIIGTVVSHSNSDIKQYKNNTSVNDDFSRLSAYSKSGLGLPSCYYKCSMDIKNSTS
jgi:hypothetical protein